MKKDKIMFYSSLMVISGIFGWVYEILFYFLNDGCKQIYLRGICFGPWIDIYVLGGLLIYLLNRKDIKSKLKVLIKSGIICGIIEYIAGFLIYQLFDGKRSWNYNTEILNFGNINGFICLRSVLFFAISGVFLMYVIVPFINKMINSKHKKVYFYIFTILCSILIIDEVYNMLISLNILSLPSADYIYRSLGFTYWYS